MRPRSMFSRPSLQGWIIEVFTTQSTSRLACIYSHEKGISTYHGRRTEITCAAAVTNGKLIWDNVYTLSGRHSEVATAVMCDSYVVSVVDQQPHLSPLSSLMHYPLVKTMKKKVRKGKETSIICNILFVQWGVTQMSGLGYQDMLESIGAENTMTWLIKAHNSH